MSLLSLWNERGRFTFNAFTDILQTNILLKFLKMSKNWKLVQDDLKFKTIIANSGTKLVVVDFCVIQAGEPCHKCKPVFTQLIDKYPNALFLGVDVDKCRETTKRLDIAEMPTFVLYKNRSVIHTIVGINPEELEEKIRSNYVQTGIKRKKSKEEPQAGRNDSDCGIQDLYKVIEQTACECLNESDETPFQEFLTGKSILLSDCDEQLILVYRFKQNIKLQSFKIKAGQNGPKLVKFFINQLTTLDFDSASNMTPAQEITLTEEELKGIESVELKYVKFQSVNNLQVFITGNQNGSEVTQVDSLQFYGVPLTTTDIGKLKPICAKNLAECQGRFNHESQDM